MNNYFDQFDQPSKGGNYFDQFDPQKPSDDGDVMRGLKVSTGELPAIAKGAVGLVGATGEQAFGEGGIWSGVKNWGLRGYQEGMGKLEPVRRETDSLTEAWGRAKQGDLGALVDWAQYGLGYSLGQLGEAAAMSVIGGAVGGAAAGPGGAAGGAATGLVAKGATKSLAKSLIEKAVAREADALVKAAEKRGVTLAAEEATAQATKTVAKEIGSTAALGALGVTQEAGSIYADAEEEAAKQGKKLDGSDIARIWGSSLAAGGVEALTDKLGLGAVSGKIKLPGAGGAVARGATGALALGAGEAGTEAAQTAIERYGAGKPLTGDDAMKDYVDSAGLGFIGGAGAGAIGGARSAPPKPTPEQQLEEAQQRLGSAKTVDEMIAAATDMATRPSDDATMAIANVAESTRRSLLDESMTTVRDGVDKAIADAEKTASTAPKEDPMRAAMDRQADLTAAAATAPTAFDRDNANAQAQLARDLRMPERDNARQLFPDGDTPLTMLQARQRLAVLRDGNPNPEQLVAVPHPTVKTIEADGRTQPAFVIQDQGAPQGPSPLPAGPQRPEAPAVKATPFDQQRVEQAAAQGDFAGARLDLPAMMQQAGFRRAQQAVEQRGGVATPEEAAVLDKASPNERLYDRIEGQDTAPAPKAKNAEAEAKAAARDQQKLVSMGLTEPAPAPAGKIEVADEVRARDPERASRLERVRSSAEFTPTAPYSTLKSEPGATDTSSKPETIEPPAPHDGGLTLAPREGTAPGWRAFDAESGTKGVPRAEMPQIKAEHRGAMVNFLNARGIEHESDTVDAEKLKPTQAEFSPEKVAKAREYTGGDRSILVSSDNHVVDGHHQWLAKREAGEPVPVIRLKAPIDKVLDTVREFPSASVDTSSEAVRDSRTTNTEEQHQTEGERQVDDDAVGEQTARQLDDSKDMVPNDPDPAEAQALEKAIAGKSFREALLHVVKSAPDATYRLIAERVLRATDKLAAAGVQFDFRVAHVGDSVPAALMGARGMARYVFGKKDDSPATITVWVNGADVTGKVGMSYRTLLHEFVHAATQPTLRLYNLRAAAGKEHSGDVAALYDVLRAMIREFNKRVAEHKAGRRMLTDFEQQVFNRRINALADPDEILAWGLTDRATQAWMESVEYQPQVSFWTKFVDSIRTLLGLPAKANTALTEVLRVADILLDAPVNSVDEMLEIAGQVGTSMEAIQDTAGAQTNTLSGESRPNASSVPEEVSKTDIKRYNGKRVAQQVLVEETGQTATLTFDAGEQLRDFDKRINAMQKLLRCLGT